MYEKQIEQLIILQQVDDEIIILRKRSKRLPWSWLVWKSR